MRNLEKYLNKLPVIPEVASKILSLGEDSRELSFRRLDEIISLDPMLTTRILKVANSALYSRQNEIKTLQMAIGLVGFNNIKSLVLLLTASQFSKKMAGDKFYDDFWRHSIVTAFISREIYSRKKARSEQDLAFSLGLLHDIGKVALYNADPDLYIEIIERAESAKGQFTAVERESLDTDHQEVGAALMEYWNLPGDYSEVCRRHGEIYTGVSPLIRNISVADVISGKMGFGPPSEHFDAEGDQFYKGSYITGVDLTYFLEEYVNVLEEDPLFLECEKLFFGGDAND